MHFVCAQAGNMMMAYRRGPERDNVVLSAAIGKASRVIMTTKPPTASKHLVAVLV
jgi:hypothetical protein